MRVLVMHNRYQEAGGEDSVFANEVALLRSGGCEVETLEVSNDAISGPKAKALAAMGSIHNPAGRRLAEQAIARFRPDIVHVHNFFPRLSPAVFDACADHGVPAVWTLHNFRIACANGLLFRDGQPCEKCVGKMPLPAIAHRCYRGSLPGSAAVAAMIGWHNARHTWHNKVSRFIALSEFSREIAIRAGLPAGKLAVKPNFVTEPDSSRALDRQRKGAVFVGRLSPEKDPATLIEAWSELPQIPLSVIGDGPERRSLEHIAPPHVRFMGHQPREVVMEAVRSAQAIIVPSSWYENFPMSVVEAMALGTPVIASRIGALAHIVTDGIDGLHFTAGDPADLARVVRSAFADPGRLATLGHGARITWQREMSPERNLELLLAIYRDAIAA